MSALSESQVKFKAKPSWPCPKKTKPFVLVPSQAETTLLEKTDLHVWKVYVLLALWHQSGALPILASCSPGCAACGCPYLPPFISDSFPLSAEYPAEDEPGSAGSFCERRWNWDWRTGKKRGDDTEVEEAASISEDPQVLVSSFLASFLFEVHVGVLPFHLWLVELFGTCWENDAFGLRRVKWPWSHKTP